MRGLRRTLGALVIAVLLLTGALLLFAVLRGRPQDLPWTPLNLAEPVGMFTGRKLAGLTQDYARCRALLDQAGIRYTPSPPVDAGQCGYRDGVRFDAGGARRIALSPPLNTACPVAAALAMWEWNVVQPAARRYFGQAVVGIENLGSYNCRQIAGSPTGSLSEHATADAIDVAGFVLEDGRKITILADWSDSGDKGTFLRAVRNGACDLFSTALSPDYNEAHRDHLHLDQAERGRMGWRTCR